MEGKTKATGCACCSVC